MWSWRAERYSKASELYNKGRALARPSKSKELMIKAIRCEKLELSVGVGADFAVEIDFFVLRGGPFHRCDSLALIRQRKNITRAGKRGNKLQERVAG
jgi:hypothetical protein